MIKDISFLKIAHEIGQSSKCVSKKIWAVIVKDNRILSSGYNGTPAWYVNCDEHWDGKYTKEHHDWSAKHEIHAEMNSLLWAARQGIGIEWATMYVMCEPCYECTKNIVAAGIKKVVYSNAFPHTDTSEARKFMADNNVTIEQIDLWEAYRYQKTIWKNY